MSRFFPKQNHLGLKPHLEHNAWTIFNLIHSRLSLISRIPFNNLNKANNSVITVVLWTNMNWNLLWQKTNVREVSQWLIERLIFSKIRFSKICLQVSFSSWNWIMKENKKYSVSMAPLSCWLSWTCKLWLELLLHQMWMYRKYMKGDWDVPQLSTNIYFDDDDVKLHFFLKAKKLKLKLVFLQVQSFLAE